MEGFWEGLTKSKTSIFALFPSFFRCQFWTTFWKAKKSKKRASAGDPPEILSRPGGMCGARGRDREGVIRRSRPRLLKLSNLGLKIFGKDLDWEFSTRRHLRWGGGTLRAFRLANQVAKLGWEASKNQDNISIFDCPNAQKQSFGWGLGSIFEGFGVSGPVLACSRVCGMLLGCVIGRQK